MVEREVVLAVEHELLCAERAYFNIHGSAFGRDGAPDFLTHDADGVMLGIECKVPGKMPVVNQWRQAIRMSSAGVRYVVAYDDFRIADVDAHTMPVVEVGSEVGVSEFLAAESVKSKKKSFEVVAKSDTIES